MSDAEDVHEGDELVVVVITAYTDADPVTGTFSESDKVRGTARPAATAHALWSSCAPTVYEAGMWGAL
ncbi:hypothetical protein [Streptomyces sp. NPDC002676]